jgi:hypothetical protein
VEIRFASLEDLERIYRNLLMVCHRMVAKN